MATIRWPDLSLGVSGTQKIKKEGKWLEVLRKGAFEGKDRRCPDPVVAVHGEAARGAYQCDKPELDVTITKDQLLGWYKQMQTMRRMETAADGVLPLGYRAVSVSFEAGIMPDDRVITAYRYHSFAVLRSGTIKGIIGRQVGMSRQMHIFTPSFFGGNGIVGTQVPVGADMAFAQKYMDKDTATFALYGDGASSQGQVLEAYNMIAIVLHPSLELEPKPCKKKKKKTARALDTKQAVCQHW
ncbi:thiamine diphosphate-binding protein [Mycena galericulata]|nr:thiamine diphosphate-binding protein [Mycena galericulata]